jgi:hypothetical protein
MVGEMVGFLYLGLFVPAAVRGRIGGGRVKP